MINWPVGLMNILVSEESQLEGRMGSIISDKTFALSSSWEMSAECCVDKTTASI